MSKSKRNFSSHRRLGGLGLTLGGVAVWALASVSCTQTPKAAAVNAPPPVAQSKPDAVVTPPPVTVMVADPKPAVPKPLIDYFKAIPILGASLSSTAWGAPSVLPRDPLNGLEDPAVKQWYYWDGQIIKGPDGRFHLFASRWNQSLGHQHGWPTSVAIHAVSDNLYGPYVDKGMLWPDNQGGKGHNVTALVLPDGTYAVVVSETRPDGPVFTSKSLDGPWTQLGTLKVNQPNWRASNVSLMVRPDGDFEIVSRGGVLLISKAKDGILGPYEPQGPSIYPPIAGLPQRNLEDPVLWYSGGFYHIVVNKWDSRKAYHLVSKDGITNWKLQGLAYDPTADLVRYTDGTVNHWFNMERPGVYLENGHVAAFTFAVLDVTKSAVHGNDNHGSKIMVIPFDGAAMDKDLANTFGDPPPSAAPAATTMPSK